MSRSMSAVRNVMWWRSSTSATHETLWQGYGREVQFDTKVAVVLRDDLAVWQKTNVTAFLVSGIAGTIAGVVGEPYRDGSGNEYLPMFVQPVLVYEADAPGLRRAYERARSRDVV